MDIRVSIIDLLDKYRYYEEARLCCQSIDAIGVNFAYSSQGEFHEYLYTKIDSITGERRTIQVLQFVGKELHIATHDLWCGYVKHYVKLCRSTIVQYQKIIKKKKKLTAIRAAPSKEFYSNNVNRIDTAIKNIENNIIDLDDYILDSWDDSFDDFVQIKNDLSKWNSKMSKYINAGESERVSNSRLLWQKIAIVLGMLGSGYIGANAKAILIILGL